MLDNLKDYKIILASASPRRKELLSQIGIDFRIDVSKAEENAGSHEPGEIVKDLSYTKAMEVYQRQSEDVIVIGADTIVYANGKVLGKPKDVQDAYEMIHMLQGAVHQVYTGVAVVCNGKHKSAGGYSWRFATADDLTSDNSKRDFLKRKSLLNFH